MKKVAVFGSGNGSNFQAIVEYFKNYDIEFTCVSDKQDSYILKRAEKLGIKNYFIPAKENYNFLKQNKFDLVVLAGYMSIIDSETLKLNRFINIHPSLLPSFKGKDAIRQAYEAGVKVTGVTVHRVTKEVDAGPILAQIPVFVETGMNLSDLEAAIHLAEHKLYPLVIENILYDKLREPHIILFNSLFEDYGSRGCKSGGCGGCHNK